MSPDKTKLPDHASMVRIFNLADIVNRRFMFDGRSRMFIVGDSIGAGAGKGIRGSHAEEFYAVTGSNTGYDECIHGWMGTTSDFPYDVIHFAPHVPEPTPDSWDYYDTAFRCLEAFAECGATGMTLVRGFGRIWEQPLSSILKI